MESAQPIFCGFPLDYALGWTRGVVPSTTEPTQALIKAAPESET